MRYILGFSKTVQVADPDLYINDCCIGGDVVLDRLLPVLRVNQGEDLQTNQDTPELEELRDLVLSQLRSWPVTNLTTEHVDEKYMPIKTGG